MFKRLTKKQKQRERDEELGLDDDAKQMFGLQDIDSDESSSGSDSDSDQNGGDEDGLDRGSAADMKTEWLAAGGQGSEDGEESDDEELDLEDDEPPIPLAAAIKNPVYQISSEKNEHACIVCPKKALKNVKMAEVHLASAAHNRRYKKFRELAESSSNRSKDPRRIVTAISQKPTTVTDEEGNSKRSLKRKQKTEAIKEKRAKTKRIIKRKRKQSAEKQKEKLEEEARKSGITGETNGVDTLQTDVEVTSERPKKKRKVAADETARQRNGGGQGGDSEVPVGQASPVQSSKMKVKTNDNVESTVQHDRAADKDSTSTPKGEVGWKASRRVNANYSKIGFFEDDGTIKETEARSMKKRDLLRLKTKGHMGRAHAGRFAKLSDTRAVKDKSKRKSRLEEKSSARKSSDGPKKVARYFDEPDDGDGEVGPKKVSAKKSKSEGKKQDGAPKGNGKRRKEKAQSMLREKVEKVADDLTIFD